MTGRWTAPEDTDLGLGAPNSGSCEVAEPTRSPSPFAAEPQPRPTPTSVPDRPPPAVADDADEVDGGLSWVPVPEVSQPSGWPVPAVPGLGCGASPTPMSGDSVSVPSPTPTHEAVGPHRGVPSEWVFEAEFELVGGPVRVVVSGWDQGALWFVSRLIAMLGTAWAVVKLLRHYNKRVALIRLDKILRDWLGSQQAVGAVADSAVVVLTPSTVGLSTPQRRREAGQQPFSVAA